LFSSLKLGVVSNSKPITSFTFVEKKLYGSSKIKLIWRILLEVCSVSELEQRLLGEMHSRIVRSFLDVLILQELGKGPMGCYDVISLIRNKHDVRLSAGKTYSCLYALEKDGLLCSELDSNKRIFMLTECGKEKVKELSREKNRILGLLLNLFEDE